MMHDVASTDVPTSREHVIEDIYAAHERRDIEGAMTFLAADVAWPNVAAGTTLHGHDELRRYWTEQFEAIDPHVTPLELEAAGDQVRVRVRQIVRDKAGHVLHEGEVVHVFTFGGTIITAMQVESA